MTWIARGMGMALGLALWPIALPVFLLLGLAAALRGDLKGEPDCCGAVPPSPGPRLMDDPTTPVIPGLMEQQLAIVTERNRQHLENTYRN